MKKLIIVIAAIFVSLSASAQLASDIYSEEREREEHDGWLQTGYRGFAEIGVPLPVQCGEDAGVSIKTIHGYQFSEWFFAGIGIGYTYFDSIGDDWYFDLGYENSCNSFNAFGDFKLTFPTGKRVYPFVETRFGVAVPSVYDGMFFFEVPVGCRIAVNDNIGINIGASFQLYGYGDVLAVGPFVSVDF